MGILYNENLWGFAMKTLYFNCAMGAAGDMLAGALLELHPAPGRFVIQFNKLGIPGVRMVPSVTTRKGVTGTHVTMEVFGGAEESGHHVHRGLSDIAAIVNALPLPEAVRTNAMAVYRSIADAEAKAHGCPVDLVHFHEVGALDAVADVTAVCWLVHELDPEVIFASPVHVGSGTVKCAHGVLPVPAPATAFLLEDIPTYGGEIKGELCTPTGAALLRHFVHSFRQQPNMTLLATGHGMGNKDFERPNCVTALWGITPP